MIQKIVYCILYFVNLLFKGLKIKENKITFISYKSNTIEGDFKLVSEKLEKENKYEIEYVLIKFEHNLIGSVKYFFNCIKQVYHINTSKVVILDYNNFVISNFKKKEVKVVQLWHATGAIKKFGNDINREYEIKNYDYVTCSSDAWKDIYSSAFSIPKENVLPVGIPKTDSLFSEKKLDRYRKNIYNKYPQIKGKKVVLYAPTFRGVLASKIRCEKVDLEYIQRELGDDYVVIHKLHPWLAHIKFDKDERIINGNNEGLRKLFSISDYLISDYSAIIFDFSILEKPMIFFTPDIEKYKLDRGFYEDYEKVMPGPVCLSEEEVVKAIKENNFSKEEIVNFKNKYFKYKDGKSTERVCELIKSLIKE